jgi:hypothetical protein
VDTSLSREMKSTGEVMGSDMDFPRALYKALLASGVKVPYKGTVVLTVADKEKAEAMGIARDWAITSWLPGVRRGRWRPAACRWRRCGRSPRGSRTSRT